jgi:hypothetical protein
VAQKHACRTDGQAQTLAMMAGHTVETTQQASTASMGPLPSLTQKSCAVALSQWSQTATNRLLRAVPVHACVILLEPLVLLPAVTASAHAGWEIQTCQNSGPMLM